MDAARWKRLEAAGWRSGTVQEFLGLSDAEMLEILILERLAREVRRVRQAAGLSQQALAGRLGSSQSRVAKLEAGDPTVSMDLLVRAHLALGQSASALGKLIASVTLERPVRRSTSMIGPMRRDPVRRGRKALSARASQR